MNFRQVFSFIKTKLKLLNKEHKGFYADVNISPTINSVLKLSDGSIVVVGAFSGYVDSNGKIYNKGSILKFLSTGEVDTTFYDNLPSNNSTGLCIATNGTDLYVGSGGGSLGGIRKFSTSGVIDQTFYNSVGTKFNGAVYSIAANATDLYVGGSFTSFNSIANNANRIAKLTTAGVFDTAFSNNLDVVSGTKATTSGFNGDINSIIINGTDLYLGGVFSSFKGTANNARSIAKITTSGIFDTAFSNNLDVVSGTKTTTSGFNNTVFGLATDGTSLYTVGGFTSFKGTANNARNIAKLSTAGVFDTAFSNNLDVVSGTKATTSGFNASITIGARAIVIDGTSLYVGGDFSSFKGTANNARKIAKLSTVGVFDTAFSNNLDLVSGTKAITSGFDDYNNNLVKSIVVDGTNLYTVGDFRSFKNNSAFLLKKITNTGISQSFFTDSSQFFNNFVYTIAVDSDGTRYVGGDSSLCFNGRYIGGIAKILPSGELDSTFSTNVGTGFNNTIQKIIIIGTNLYIVGDFTSFNGVLNNARGIAKLSTSGVFDTAFSNNLDVVSGTKATTSGFTNPTVKTISTDGTSLYVGGSFTSFKGTANNANRIAKLSILGVFDTTFSNNLDIVSGTKAATSGFNGTISTIVADATDLYIGGSFTSFKGTTNNANRIAKLSILGVFDTAFSNNLDVVSGTKATTSGFNTSVSILIKSNTDLYIGGNFTSFKGITNNANYIAKLSTSGVFDTTFSDNLDVVSGTKSTTSGFNSTVNTIEIIGTILFVGGNFNSFKGVSSNANYLAKLDTSGIFDTAFSNYLDKVPGTKQLNGSGFDSFVFDLKYNSKYSSLVAAGYFSVFKSEPVYRLYTISIST